MTTPIANERKLSRRQLQKTISAMVVDIEIMVGNINSVLVEVRDLVQQIDTITEKMEDKYEKGVKTKDVKLHLDKNRNVCDVTQDIPTFELENNKNRHNSDNEVFSDIILNFTYNDKYPLWIQSHNWTTKTSVSELSEISSGSDYSDIGSHSDDVSWKNVSNIDLMDFDCGRNADEVVRRLSKCCVNKSESKSDIEDVYCGVYEAIMEEMLEYSGDVTWSDQDIMTSSSEYDCRTYVSISDENFISYKRSQPCAV